MKKHRQRPFFRALQNYVTFFLLVAFIVSCCMMLFVSTLADSMGLVFTKENVAAAAKVLRAYLTSWRAVSALSAP